MSHPFLHSNIDADLVAKTKRIQITYTDCGIFYGAYLHAEPVYSIHDNWFNKLRTIRDVNDFLAHLKIIPRIEHRWNYKLLEKVCAALKEAGINADFDNHMDVS